MNDRGIEKKARLFEEAGPENTKSCFEIVASRADEMDPEHVVLATTTGETGARAVEHFRDHDINLVVVSHQYGFREDGRNELEEEYVKPIQDHDWTELVTTPDVLTRVPKMVRGKYDGYTFLDVVSDTLRIFSEGMKVCVECSIQAADSGKIPVNEEIAAIAGTGKGADTGIVLEAQHSHKLFDIDLKEIICMPRNR